MRAGRRSRSLAGHLLVERRNRNGGFSGRATLVAADSSRAFAPIVIDVEKAFEEERKNVVLKSAASTGPADVRGLQSGCRGRHLSLQWASHVGTQKLFS